MAFGAEKDYTIASMKIWNGNGLDRKNSYKKIGSLIKIGINPKVD